MVIGFDGSRAFGVGRTGTENYSHQLLKNLARIDQINQYIVYLRSSISEDMSQWPKNFQFQVINWPRLWTQGGLAVQTLKDKLDVLFVPAHTLPLLRKPGLKTVITVHDLGSEYLPSTHQLKQRFYLGLMQKYQLKTATQLIAVSKATKKDLIKRVGIEPEKVSVVYEGYDEKLFKPVKDDLLINTLIHYNLQPKTYYLFVGTIQPRKNLERLIRVFELYCRSFENSGRQPHSLARQRERPADQQVDPRIRSTSSTLGLAAFGGSLPSLVIAGSQGWLSDRIYALPKELGVEEKVKFLGYVPNEDLPALYSGALALTFPSLFEGFGLPILEAQACGCPVLTSNVSSLPEVAGKAAVYVDPYSVNDIVKGMEEINNQDTRNKLIKAGLENIKRFSWEKCAKGALQVLEKAI